MQDNPLLFLNEIPKFDQLKAEHIEPAMRKRMDEARQQIETLKAEEKINWNNTVEILSDIGEAVGRIWGVVSHIASVVDTAPWREAYNALIPEVSVFFTEIAQDMALFKRLETIQNSSEYADLRPDQQKKLANDLRDFILSGAKLPENEKKRLAQLSSESASLSAAFAQNVLDSTNAQSWHFTDPKELQGLPESALSMFAAAAKEAGKEGYLIGLHAPHYLAIAQYADQRELRESLYRAYVARASELDDASRDNTANIDRILTIAAEEAQLLGYANYATVSLVPKMAESPEQVIDFLTELADKAKPAALRDFAELADFARDEYGMTDLQPWDIAYYSEKLREAKYAFSEEEVRQYFPADKVLAGLFSLIERLYGIHFVAQKRPVWHSDVHYFALQKEGETIGGVYLDLYARSGKRGGAWMNDYCGRRRTTSGSLQLPIAYLVCNFAPPVAGKAYLTHDEILTLFHETGHGLHHLLTRIDELGVSGINGVEWDAVELPSQFMENFAWQWEVLHTMSCHQKTAERLPENLFAKMRAAKNFQTGMFLVRQLEFALFDMQIYQHTTQPCDWQNILQQVRQTVSVVPSIAENRFAHAFSHIFAGGYSAGYYSYIWAEVLSADVYAAFVEENNWQQTGARFWQEILSMGGARSAHDSFVAFRNRTPSVDALLADRGLLPEA